MYFSNVYISETQLDGNILLVQKKLYTDEYISYRQLDGNILLKKIYKIEPSDIKLYDFTNSEILKCNFYPKISKEFKLKFNSINNVVYNAIYDMVGNTEDIIKNTILNIKEGKKNDKGFSYYENLNISVQGADANKTIKEIINQCVKKKIRILLQIELNDGKIYSIDT